MEFENFLSDFLANEKEAWHVDCTVVVLTVTTVFMLTFSDPILLINFNFGRFFIAAASNP